MDTLADALPAEIDRVRKLQDLYRSVPNGHFAAAMMDLEIKQAIKASVEGDVVAMMASLKSLSEYSE